MKFEYWSSTCEHTVEGLRCRQIVALVCVSSCSRVTYLLAYQNKHPISQQPCCPHAPLLPSYHLPCIHGLSAMEYVALMIFLLHTCKQTVPRP